MCGIAGIVEVNHSESSINSRLLKQMSDVVIHRGPDAEGQWISQSRRCGMTFRRLSIVDLSPAGNQPMTTSDGNYAIVFNGEVYNHLTIRGDLEAKGYSYKSRSDTETLLYGYQEYGESLLQKMVGMWGMAVWNEERQELFCARDRIGIKPLYYYYENGVFIFASEIKSILCHHSVSVELCKEELPIYLNYGMSGNKQTLFKNIKKLPAGHCLRLTKDGTLTIRRYWSPMTQCSTYESMSETEITAEILRLLRQSIKDRMMSDVPFGAFLSGGIDSSLNVALMAEIMDRPVDTFTVGFKELSKYNELDYARKVAQLFKTNHHEIQIDEQDAFSILEQLPWFEDEPNGDPVCIPLYFLSKLTRDSGTVVIQVGEGSDEQFIGYGSMLRDYNFYREYWAKFEKLPSIIKRGVFHAVKPLFKAAAQELPLDYLRRAAFDVPLYWGGKSFFSSSHLEDLFTKEFAHNAFKPDEYILEIYNDALSQYSKADILQQMVYVELSSRLPEMLLMRVDKIGMAHSIEARVPFLDHRLVEFIVSLPAQMRVPERNTTKYLLKKASRGIIPDEIIDRKKQGFWAPIHEWLRDEWHDYAKSKILDSPLMKEGIFNTDSIMNIFNRHKHGKGNEGTKLFFLLMLSLWWERFMK